MPVPATGDASSEFRLLLSPQAIWSSVSNAIQINTDDIEDSYSNYSNFQKKSTIKPKFFTDYSVLGKHPPYFETLIRKSPKSKRIRLFFIQDCSIKHKTSINKHKSVFK